jgi:uncharacterized cupin superfamily protein
MRRMRRIDISDPDFDHDPDDPPGFRIGALKTGPRLGASRTGASVYELPPGERSFPYHVHHANEELLIVLDGEVTVRREGGEEELGPGDAALFPAGREGAHQAINRSERPVRFLVVSTMVHPEVLEYPDSGKVGLMTGAPPGKGDQGAMKEFLRRDAQMGYLEDEPTE